MNRRAQVTSSVCGAPSFVFQAPVLYVGHAVLPFQVRLCMFACGLRMDVGVPHQLVFTGSVAELGVKRSGRCRYVYSATPVRSLFAFQVSFSLAANTGDARVFAPSRICVMLRAMALVRRSLHKVATHGQ